MFQKIFHLDPEKVLSAFRLVSQADLKKTKVKLELLADIDMLSVVEKGIRGLILQFIAKFM